jgi:membrane protease YdiL (CAAX protease family)
VRSAVGHRLRNNDLAGFVIGLVYWRSRKNLLAAVLTHALIDAVPALTLIHCGPG